MENVKNFVIMNLVKFAVLIAVKFTNFLDQEVTIGSIMVIFTVISVVSLIKVVVKKYNEKLRAA